MSEATELSKEERILRVMKRVLTDIEPGVAEHI